jgi:hypothetical protein
MYNSEILSYVSTDSVENFKNVMTSWNLFLLFRSRWIAKEHLKHESKFLIVMDLMLIP